MNLTKHLAGLLGAAASLGAAAAPPAANGVMEFPHVRVAAQAPPASTDKAPADQAARGGLLAFKDPATGKLIGPSPQQATALTGPLRGAATAGRSPKPTLTRPPHGGVAVMLDESHQRYAIARKDADGQLTEACAPDARLGERHEK